MTFMREKKNTTARWAQSASDRSFPTIHRDTTFFLSNCPKSTRLLVPHGQRPFIGNAIFCMEHE